jgi:predicted MFS family arabinose efflux permease
LPVIARPHGAIGYGVVLGSFGLGALAGAAVLSMLRRQLSVDWVVAVSTVIFALATFAAGRVVQFEVLCAILFIAGTGWISVLACLNVAAQTMSPNWVLARALSMYVLVLQGGMAAGSALWGVVATRAGVPDALLYASLGLGVGLATMKWHRLRTCAVETVKFAETGITQA